MQRRTRIKNFPIKKKKKSSKKKRIKRAKQNIVQYKKTLIESRKSLRKKLREIEKRLGSLLGPDKVDLKRLLIATKADIAREILALENELRMLKTGETGLGKRR